MSVQFIMSASIFNVPNKGVSRQKKRKQALKAVGGRKSASEVTTKLLDGRKRKCLHYQVSQHGFKAKVDGELVKLGDERTYTPEMLAEKNAAPNRVGVRGTPKPKTHKARSKSSKFAKGLRHGK